MFWSLEIFHNDLMEKIQCEGVPTRVTWETRFKYHDYRMNDTLVENKNLDPIQCMKDQKFLITNLLLSTNVNSQVP